MIVIYHEKLDLLLIYFYCDCGRLVVEGVDSAGTELPRTYSCYPTFEVARTFNHSNIIHDDGEK